MIFRKKKIEHILKDACESKLNRVFGTWDLTLLGIGAIIGAGVFVVTGIGATTAGPGIVISFVIASIACYFAALSYAELASAIPISGSAYTYIYVALGEFFAWLIGWVLTMGYTLGASAVAVGLSGYLQAFLAGFGITIPIELSVAYGVIPGTTTWFNLPAFLIMVLITYIVAKGVRESARLNTVLVVVKVGVILFFIVIGSFYVRPSNWQPFAPYGAQGIVSAAAIIFFAFIGFDMVASAAEETKDPCRDLPRSILLSLTICTLLYIAVALVMTGIVPYKQYIGINNPVSFAIQSVGHGWLGGVVTIGAAAGMTTSLLALIYTQARLLYAMSRDQLLPEIFAKIHPVYKTPFASTWLIGITGGMIGAGVPLSKLLHMVNLGLLIPLCFTSIAVVVIRKTHPDLPRRFRCPWVPLVPICAVLSLGFLLSQLEIFAWLIFSVWLVLGLVLYFGYSRFRMR